MSRTTNKFSSLSIHFFERMLVVLGSARTLKVGKTGKPLLAIIFLLCVDFFTKTVLYTWACHENLRRQNVMSKARLAVNKEKNGTQRDVNSSLPELGLTYSPAIYFTYIIYKCRCFLMTQLLLHFPDRSREIYACDMVWGYFPLIGIIQFIFNTFQNRSQVFKLVKNFEVHGTCEDHM